MRGLSDEICTEHGLTVIKNPSGKTPRNIYFAEKSGEPTKFNLMREAIDYAITCSVSHTDFRKVMRELGYIVELNPNCTYWTIRSLNSKKCVRMFRLGEDYTNQRITERIRAEGNQRYAKSNEFWDERKRNRNYIPKKVYLKGSIKLAKKITGLSAFYILFAYLLGVYPRQKPRKPLSPEMREAWLKIERYSNEIRLVHTQKFANLNDVEKFINSTQNEICELEITRKKIYNKLRRCNDTDKKELLFSQRDLCTEKLTLLRKQKKLPFILWRTTQKLKKKFKLKGRHKIIYMVVIMPRNTERRNI